jgi:nucleotide-binding universal stress UspA family protein
VQGEGREEDTLAGAHLEAVHYAASRQGELVLTRHVLQGKVVPATLETLGEGDLLVMGAFGESRLSEFFRGSTTEALLRGAEVPVLLHG